MAVRAESLRTSELVEHPAERELSRRDTLAGIRPARTHPRGENTRRHAGLAHRHEHGPAFGGAPGVGKCHDIGQARRRDGQLGELRARRQ